MRPTAQIVNFPELTQYLATMPDRVFGTAAIRALNRVASLARTQASRSIRERYSVRARDVNSSLRVSRARTAQGFMKWEAALRATGRPRRNLIHFSARQTKRGVTVRIKRTGGRKLLAHAFIPTGRRTVFRRIPGTTMPSRSRYAGTKHAEQLANVTTLWVARMFGVDEVNDAVIRLIRERLPARFEHEVKNLLRRSR